MTGNVHEKTRFVSFEKNVTGTERFFVGVDMSWMKRQMDVMKILPIPRQLFDKERQAYVTMCVCGI